MTALPLGKVIEQARFAEFVRNEKAIEERLGSGVILPWREPLSLEHRARFDLFAKWCAQKTVRSCPATPSVVALWISETIHRERDFILDVLDAITVVHNYWQLANPVATPAVAFMLITTDAIEAPRSFRKDEQLAFAGLPRNIQRAVARRERDKEKAVHKAQNEAGDLRLQITKLELQLRNHKTEQKEDSDAHQDREILGHPGVSTA